MCGPPDLLFPAPEGTARGGPRATGFLHAVFSEARTLPYPRLVTLDQAARTEDDMGSPGGPARLRILIVYDCLYPVSTGGIEKRNHELASVLAGRGHDVTIASWAHGVEDGVPYGIAGMGERPPLYGENGRRSSMAAARFAAAAARLDLASYDVIETANIPYIHVLPLAARARLQRRPLLVTWHEYWGRYWKEYVRPALWPGYASIELAAAQAGSRAIAVSELTAGRLARRRRGERPAVVPNGVHVEAIAEAAAGVGGAGPGLIYAGRLLREKRLDLLFEALRLLPARHAGVALTVVGDGPHAEALHALARALGLEGRVLFRGRLPASEDVWRELGTARIAVQPSSREGFGIFPLEAMAAGLPVVYCHSRESALPELVRDGREGRMAAPTPAALAAVLTEVLDDEPGRAAMAVAARERAIAYDWVRVGEQFVRMALALAAS